MQVTLMRQGCVCCVSVHRGLVEFEGGKKVPAQPKLGRRLGWTPGSQHLGTERGLTVHHHPLSTVSSTIFMPTSLLLPNPKPAVKNSVNCTKQIGAHVLALIMAREEEECHVSSKLDTSATRG
ncbi:hypothetical protein H113_05437 [Trichophyton rubrum MR1459]|nr:hypothetical protein H113_05437 [Trichophyton rubrum MR1459]KMQ43185.1 hypothetical protein HL42_6114 [Trichophyton rubrum]